MKMFEMKVNIDIHDKENWSIQVVEEMRGLMDYYTQETGLVPNFVGLALSSRKNMCVHPQVRGGENNAKLLQNDQNHSVYFLSFLRNSFQFLLTFDYLTYQMMDINRLVSNSFRLPLSNGICFSLYVPSTLGTSQVVPALRRMPLLWDLHVVKGGMGSRRELEGWSRKYWANCAVTHTTALRKLPKHNNNP